MVSRFVWKGLVVKDVNIVERAGKAPLTFVDVVDPQTYESSGQYLYLPENRSEQCPPRGAVVDVYTKPGIYNGRPTINFASVQISKPDSNVKAS